MKIIAYDRMKRGARWTPSGPICRKRWPTSGASGRPVSRENYARADALGVVIVFECDSVEEAKRYVDDFPLSKAGFLDWFYIPVGAPLPLEFLFDPGIHVHEPLDRTKQPARQ